MIDVQNVACPILDRDENECGETSLYDICFEGKWRVWVCSKHQALANAGKPINISRSYFTEPVQPA